MKYTVILAISFAMVGAVEAQTYDPSRSSSYGNGTFGTGSNPNSHQTQGYTTQSGTYVQPHQQTNPNSTQMDNYGTRGNLNPSTGAYGTRQPRY